MTYFQKDQWEWVKRTFPGEKPEGVLRHLAEEIKELEENPSDPEEMADCFLLLQCLASHYGVNLVDAAKAKHEKNKRRTWKQVEGKGFRHA